MFLFKTSHVPTMGFARHPERFVVSDKHEDHQAPRILPFELGLLRSLRC